MNPQVEQEEEPTPLPQVVDELLNNQATSEETLEALRGELSTFYIPIIFIFPSVSVACLAGIGHIGLVLSFLILAIIFMNPS